MTILLYAFVVVWALYVLSITGLLLCAGLILRNLIKGIV